MTSQRGDARVEDRRSLFHRTVPTGRGDGHSYAIFSKPSGYSVALAKHHDDSRGHWACNDELCHRRPTTPATPIDFHNPSHIAQRLVTDRSSPHLPAQYFRPQIRHASPPRGASDIQAGAAPDTNPLIESFGCASPAAPASAGDTTTSLENLWAHPHWHGIQDDAPGLPWQDYNAQEAHSTAVIDRLRNNILGSKATCTTPFGTKRMVYADWAATGRLLSVVEDFQQQCVAPWYANVHTDVGECAVHTAALYEEARACVAASVGAPQEVYSTIFVGSGMTAAAFKLAHLLGLTQRVPDGAPRPVVMYSILEHHSNCVLWRELDVCTVVLATSLFAATVMCGHCALPCDVWMLCYV
jgi:hypothetical protein